VWISGKDESATHCADVSERIRVNDAPVLLLVFNKLGAKEEIQYSGETATSELPSHASSSAEEDGQNALPSGPALVIAYNPIVRDVTRRLLDKTGHTNEAFSSLDDATVWLITHNVRPAFIAIDISDYDDGLDWIDDMRNRCGDISCLCFTNGETYDDIPGTGMNGFLVKPFDLDSLTKELIGLNLPVENREIDDEDLTSVQSDTEVAQL
jgi:CheY-like chemotaxis protein